MPAHDVVVIGASAGGIEALSTLVKYLPAQFPAAIFVVVHFPATGYSLLPRILQRSGPLPAVHAADGEAIQKGKIVIAPPNQHLVLQPDAVHLNQGPRQHGFRPAIDALFFSAAQSFGSRVVGVLLSGALSDGVAGLQMIRAEGGETIVQDPQEAIFPILPNHAIQKGTAGYILPVVQIASLLKRLVREPAGPERGKPMEETSDSSRVQQEIRAFELGEKLDSSTMFTCPDCGGVLWEIRDGKIVKYRCHVGHVYSDDSLLEEQGAHLEAALWASVRLLEERATLFRRLAGIAGGLSGDKTVKKYLQRANENEAHAQALRQLMRYEVIEDGITFSAGMNSAEPANLGTGDGRPSAKSPHAGAPGTDKEG